jgi:hypothetical protein
MLPSIDRARAVPWAAARRVTAIAAAALMVSGAGAPAGQRSEGLGVHVTVVLSCALSSGPPPDGSRGGLLSIRCSPARARDRSDRPQPSARLPQVKVQSVSDGSDTILIVDF